MTFLHAIVLGVIEGITEFLPISSTGHMILASDLIGLAQSDFVKSFEIAIQLGAIAAVVVLYTRRLFTSRAVAERVAIAFVPTAVVGFLLYKVIKTYFFSDSVVLWALFIGGLAIIGYEKWYGEKTDAVREIEKITYKQAGLIGLAQSLAVIPGVSRAAATILGGMALGVSRKAIVEFSFLLAIPTMLAATVLDLAKSGFLFTSEEYSLLTIGFATAFISALFVVRAFVKYVQTRDFTPFGLYRIIIALFGWLLI